MFLVHGIKQVLHLNSNSFEVNLNCLCRYADGGVSINGHCVKLCN